MRITIEMPIVEQCTVTDCAYNVERTCHARAITVGDGLHPGCDTFFRTSGHTHQGQRAGVGACKVTGCTFNDDFECMAESISVGRDGDDVHCLTYTAR
jgi:hypothetical protein